MLTPKLEQLIWEGKAWFKTKVIGGTNAFNLFIQEDRFIIITDLLYQNSALIDKDKNPHISEVFARGMNTQLTVLGERNINRFLFRNNFNIIGQANSLNADILPFGSYKVDTYLIHTTSVRFSFVTGADLSNINQQPASYATPALKIPVDYGKQGDPIGSFTDSINQFDTNNGGTAFTVNTEAQFVSGVNNANEFAFPVGGFNTIYDDRVQRQFDYPILLVNYVEILGSPNNLGI